MKLNKKGVSIVELIISVALIALIMLFMYRLLSDITYEKNNDSFASFNQEQRVTIINRVSKAIKYNNGVTKITTSVNTLYFKNNSNVELFQLKIDNNKIIFKENGTLVDSWVIKGATLSNPTCSGPKELHNGKIYQCTIEVYTDNVSNIRDGDINNNNIIDDFIFTFVVGNGTTPYLDTNIGTGTPSDIEEPSEPPVEPGTEYRYWNIPNSSFPYMTYSNDTTKYPDSAATTRPNFGAYIRTSIDTGKHDICARINYDGNIQHICFEGFQDKTTSNYKNFLTNSLNNNGITVRNINCSTSNVIGTNNYCILQANFLNGSREVMCGIWSNYRRLDGNTIPGNIYYCSVIDNPDSNSIYHICYATKSGVASCEQLKY